jgi:hypothetical protein
VKIGSDDHQAYIIQDDINCCKCCGRESDTRMGYCWDCVESEAAMIEFTDMYDNPIPLIDGLTKGMSLLQFILKKYIKVRQ